MRQVQFNGSKEDYLNLCRQAGHKPDFTEPKPVEHDWLEEVFAECGDGWGGSTLPQELASRFREMEDSYEHS